MMTDKPEKKKELPFGPTHIERYPYECPSCGYHDDIEDIVVDAYFFSQGCKKGEYPKFTCPKCHNTMKYVGS
jgi:DNA-directed RNA polymerase subunit M/transcription elongation factor TFIIS